MKKVSKITKKEISAVLKTLDRTSIFRLAKRCGVDVSNKSDVFKFIVENTNLEKVKKSAYNIAYYPFKGQFKSGRSRSSRVLDAINSAKRQKTDGSMDTNYFKVLIEGDTFIYWAHPVYGHSDYNKSRAFENTPKNRKIADVINAYLRK